MERNALMKEQLLHGDIGATETAETDLGLILNGLNALSAF